MKRFVLIFTLFFLLVPVCSWAEGVIGVDKEFNIKAVQFLIANTSDQKPFVEAFNYFFTLELFCGLLALWLRLVVRPFRM